MIRCDSFGRSLLFAAVAAAGALPFGILFAPTVGAWQAQAWYLVLVTASYVAAIAPARRAPLLSRLGIALCAVAVGAAVIHLARTTADLAVGLALLLGLARSGFLYRSAPARAALIETVLLLGGLLFARQLGGAWYPLTGLTLWGFLLVQSCFFLVQGVERRRADPQLDPFEAAHRRAQALLDRAVV